MELLNENERLLSIIKCAVGNYWCNINSEDVKVYSCKSFSNKVSIISIINPSENSNQSLLSLVVKEYASGELDNIVHRRKENEISNFIANNGIGPKIMFCDKFLRIEEKIDGNPMNFDEVNTQETRYSMMKKIANFNKQDSTILRESTVFQFEIQNSNAISSIVENLKGKPKFGKLSVCLELLNSNEIAFLESILPNPTSSNTCFCHNDLLSLNILKSQNDYMIIDYECVERNYIGYDIASFVNESTCNYLYEEFPYFKYNIETEPNQEELKRMIALYVFHFFSSSQESEDINETIEISGKLYSNQIDFILNYFIAFRMLSHYYGMVWSLLMLADESKKHLDFQEYSLNRAKEYIRLKTYLC